MRLSSLFASTILAAGLAIMGTSAASAAPITFTWDPSATSGGTLSTAGTFSPKFTATNLTVKDYATIDLSNLANVTESGTLVVTAIDGFTPGFVNGTGNAALAVGASPYQLYFTFSSTSFLAPDGSGGFKGQFTSLSYTLWGDQGGACTFSISGAACGASGTQLQLATGTLSNIGLNSVAINSGGIPAANVNVDINSGANAGGFFFDPSDLTGFLFETAFTNTPGVVGHPSATLITINGGGGNVDMIPVPEPVTLSVFGAGLAGAVAMRRRRKAKKA
jgi:hypothetical protein